MVSATQQREWFVWELSSVLALLPVPPSCLLTVWEMLAPPSCLVSCGRDAALRESQPPAQVISTLCCWYWSWSGGAPFFFLFGNLFFWSIVDLQSCVNFCCAANGFSYTYFSFLKILFIYFLFLAASGLSCGTRDLSLCVVRGVVACGFSLL